MADEYKGLYLVLCILRADNFVECLLYGAEISREVNSKHPDRSKNVNSRIPMKNSILLASLLAALTLTACGKKEEAAAPAAPAAAAPAAAAPAAENKDAAAAPAAAAPAASETKEAAPAK